ncbi:MAG: Na/Pi cotransporter family protein [Eubacteriales bacterium]|nr:Na/Pi cotransporter family protein [Eubacteriales bacterium]
MDFFTMLTFIGGLAFFLFGMSVMGDGLSKLSGGRLEQILENLTSTPLKGVLLGAAVTAIIQSSSATTVMVVGFVNSGIMKLSQAVSIIMGANIGTTITSWILSLTGIEGDSFFLQLLKPTSFSPILALIGIIFYMFSKSQKKKDIGSILLGFSILMFGMDTMSSSVKPLADVPEFTGILTAFSNPVLGLLAGTVLTAIIQSSSASVGILQALCATGAVTYGAALPIIMGQNIGTCVTALLSAIGANKNARRAAMVHLYFNVIGTITFMILFYLTNAVIHFDFLQDTAGVAGIAVIHTAFNIFATLLLLPFSKVLEKLAVLTIRDSHSDTRFLAKPELPYLDVRFLDTPALAMEHSHHAALIMAEDAEASLRLAMELLSTGYNEEQAASVTLLEDKLDHYETELSQYLLMLSGKSLSSEDSHTLTILLQSLADLERISDHSLLIVKSAREIHEKGLSFSQQAKEELLTMTKTMSEILKMTYQTLETQSIELASHIEPMETELEKLGLSMKRQHIQRLRDGLCTVEMGFILTDITTSLERAAAHCSNIASYVCNAGRSL